jgi:putative DNA primase/helicase
MHEMGYNRRLIEKQRARFAGYRPPQPPLDDQTVLLNCLQTICSALAAPAEAPVALPPPYVEHVPIMAQLEAADHCAAPAFTSANAPADPSRATAWLWPGVLPLGALTLLSGQPKMGKSTIAVNMAAVVSSGDAWPTGEACAPGGVILVETEDSFTDTQLRLMAAGADLRRVVVRDREAGPLDLSTAEGMAALDGQASAMGGVRLLVLSPLLSFFGKSVGGDDTAIRGRLAPLLQWAAHYRVAVLGLMHPAKNAGRGLEAQFAGADGYRRAARAAFVAMRDPSDDKRRVLACAGINGAADNFGLLYRIESAEASGQQTARVVWLAGDEAAQLGDEDDENDGQGVETGGQTQVAKAVQFLVKALAGGPRPGAELKTEAAGLGIPGSTLDRAADELLGVVKTGAHSRAPKTWALP